MKLAPLLFSSLLLAQPLAAEIPNRIPHQGRIAVDGVNFDGPGQFKFLLYLESAGGPAVPLWSNSTTSPADLAEPGTAVSLPVTKGLYSVSLGDTTVPNMAALPASLEPPQGSSLSLRLWFDDGSNGFQQLAPDREIASTVFALHAGKANTLPAGAVTSSMLAEGAVTNSKLGDSAVTPDKIAPNLQSGPTVPDPGNIDLTISPAVDPENFGLSMTATIEFPQPFFTPPDVQAGPASTVSNVTATGFSVRRSVNAFKILENFRRPSVTIVDGRPAVTMDATNGLFFIRALDSRGDAWPESPSVITTESSTGTSLAIIGGKPAVLYVRPGFSPTTSTIRFVLAQDAQGSAWNVPVTVLGPFPSSNDLPPVLCEVDGAPAALISAPGSKDLLYLRANEVSGQTWGPPVTIVASDGPGNFVVGDLAVIDGRPAVAFAAVAFADGISRDLRYVRANDSQGATWPAPAVADPAAPGKLVIPPVDLAEVDGHPAVAYYLRNDPGGTEVNFLRAEDPAGGSWGSRRTVFTSNLPFDNGNLSLAMVGGRPGILLRSDRDFSVQFALANDSSGSMWPEPQSWNTGAVRGSDQSFGLIEVEGGPAAAFRFDYSNGVGDSLRGVLYVGANQVEWTAASSEPGYAIIAERAESVTDRSITAVDHAFSAAQETVRHGQYSVSGDELTLAIDFEEEFEAIPAVTIPPGELALATVTTSGFTATATLVRAVIDDTDDAGRFVSLVIAAGHPAVAYHARTAGALRFARSIDPEGSAWNNPVTIDSTSGAGPYVSLAIIAGNPAVLYYRRSAGQLIYRRANDSAGTSWGDPFVIAGVPTFVASEETGHEVALLDVGGHPAAAWFDDSLGLRYRRANNATGSLWGPAQTTVPNSGTLLSGAGLAMAIVDGYPAISFLADQSAALRDVRYVRASDPTGSAWNPPVPVDTGSIVDSGPFGINTTTFQGSTALGTHDGTPFLIYEIHVNSTVFGPTRILRFAMATDPVGVQWNSSFGSADDATAPAASIIGGVRAVTFYNHVAGNLRISLRGESTFAALLDGSSGDDVGRFSSIAEVAGAPAVAYYDSTNQRLKFVRVPPISIGRWTASDGMAAPIAVALAQSVPNGSITAGQLGLGGKPGQVLRSTGTSVAWSEYGLTLDDDSLTLLGTNPVSLGQYLRDDGSEPISGSLTVTQGASFGGSIGVDGSVIANGASLDGPVVATEHNLPSARTFTRNIAGNSLVAREADSFFRSSLGFIRSNSSSISLYGNVQLPDGATVTGAKLLYYDNSAPGDFTNFSIRFRRRALASTGAENIGALDQASPAGGISSAVRPVPITIESSRATIDNSAYQYWVHVDASGVPSGDPDLRIYGFEILYTLETLLP